MYVKYVLSLTKFSNISSLEIFLQQTEFLSDILPFYQHRTESLLSYLTVLSAPDWIFVITSYSFISTGLNLCYHILQFYLYQTEPLLSNRFICNGLNLCYKILQFYQHQTESLLSYLTVLSAPDWIFVIRSYSFISTVLNLCYKILPFYQHRTESLLSDLTVLSAPYWIFATRSYSFISNRLNLCYHILPFYLYQTESLLSDPLFDNFCLNKTELRVSK